MISYFHRFIKRFLDWLHESMSKKSWLCNRESLDSLLKPGLEQIKKDRIESRIAFGRNFPLLLGDILVKDGIIYAIYKIIDDSYVECFMQESTFSLNSESGAITVGPYRIFTMKEVEEIFSSEEYKNTLEDFKKNYFTKYHPAVLEFIMELQILIQN